MLGVGSEEYIGWYLEIKLHMVDSTCMGGGDVSFSGAGGALRHADRRLIIIRFINCALVRPFVFWQGGFFWERGKWERAAGKGATGLMGDRGGCFDNDDDDDNDDDNDDDD